MDAPGRQRTYVDSDPVFARGHERSIDLTRLDDAAQSERVFWRDSRNCEVARIDQADLYAVSLLRPGHRAATRRANAQAGRRPQADTIVKPPAMAPGSSNVPVSSATSSAESAPLDT